MNSPENECAVSTMWLLLLQQKISETVFKDRRFSLCGGFLNLKFDLSTIKSIYSWQNHVPINLI